MTINVPTNNITQVKWPQLVVIAVNAIEAIAEQVRLFLETYPSHNEARSENADPDRNYAFLIAKLKYLSKVTKACYTENNWRFDFEYPPASGIQATVMPVDEYYQNHAGAEPNKEFVADALPVDMALLEKSLTTDGTRLFNLLIEKCRELDNESYEHQVFDDELYLICCDLFAWMKYVDRWQGWVHVHNVIGHPDRWSVKVVLPDDRGNYRPIDL